MLALCPDSLPQVVDELGLCVAIHDIIKTGDSIVHPSEGFARCDVRFEAVFFRPFVGEVCEGTLLASSSSGLKGAHPCNCANAMLTTPRLCSVPWFF